MLIDARLQTATSSMLVFSSISVQRFELWMTPQWSCGRADVRGILPGHPRVAGLEEHLEHLFPERQHADLCGPRSCRPRPAPRTPHTALERAAVKLGQVGRVVGAEERPGGVLRQRGLRRFALQALHEHVRESTGPCSCYGCGGGRRRSPCAGRGNPRCRRARARGSCTARPDVCRPGSPRWRCRSRLSGTG